MTTRVIYDGTQAGSLGSGGSGTTTNIVSGAIVESTTAFYAIGAPFLFSTPISLAGFVPLDKILYTLKISSASIQYVRIRLHGSNGYSELFPLVQAIQPSQLNQPLLHAYVLPPDFLSNIGSAITSISVSAYGPGGTVTLTDIRLQTTDRGSDRPTIAPRLLAGLPAAPSNALYYADVSGVTSLAPNNASWKAFVGSSAGVRFDGGSHASTYGIPFNKRTTSEITALLTNVSRGYSTEIDYPGQLPIASSLLREAGGAGADKHVLTIDTQNGDLYEAFQVSFAGEQAMANADAADAGFVGTPTLPYATWAGKTNISILTGGVPDLTRATASALDLYPQLGKYDEFANASSMGGTFGHMLRITVPQGGGSRRVWPALHSTGGLKGSNSHLYDDGWQSANVPLGAIWRLSPTFDISGFPSHVQIVLRTLQKYGAIVDDWGSAMLVTMERNDGWASLDFSSMLAVKVTNGDFLDLRQYAIDSSSIEVNMSALPAPTPTPTPTPSTTGNFVSEPLVSRTGTVKANKKLNFVALYYKSTKQLAILKENIYTNNDGVFMISDSTITPGTEYYAAWEDEDGGYRLPSKAAT